MFDEVPEGTLRSDGFPIENGDFPIDSPHLRRRLQMSVPGAGPSARDPRLPGDDLGVMGVERFPQVFSMAKGG